MAHLKKDQKKDQKRDKSRQMMQPPGQEGDDLGVDLENTLTVRPSAPSNTKGGSWATCCSILGPATTTPLLRSTAAQSLHGNICIV